MLIKLKLYLMKLYAQNVINNILELAPNMIVQIVVGGQDLDFDFILPDNGYKIIKITYFN